MQELSSEEQDDKPRAKSKRRRKVTRSAATDNTDAATDNTDAATDKTDPATDKTDAEVIDLVEDNANVDDYPDIDFEKIAGVLTGYENRFRLSTGEPVMLSFKDALRWLRPAERQVSSSLPPSTRVCHRTEHWIGTTNYYQGKFVVNRDDTPCNHEIVDPKDFACLPEEGCVRYLTEMNRWLKVGKIANNEHCKKSLHCRVIMNAPELFERAKSEDAGAKHVYN